MHYFIYRQESQCTALKCSVVSTVFRTTLEEEGATPQPTIGSLHARRIARWVICTTFTRVRRHSRGAITRVDS